jgi:hypothetical protein
MSIMGIISRSGTIIVSGIGAVVSSFLLMEDGVSYILLEDGVSKIII